MQTASKGVMFVIAFFQQQAQNTYITSVCLVITIAEQEIPIETPIMAENIEKV